MPHTNLTYAFSFLEQLVRRRLEQELKNEGRPSEPAPMPSFSEDDGSPFTYFLHNYRPTRDELATLLMALAPNVYPHFFDALISEYLQGRRISGHRRHQGKKSPGHHPHRGDGVVPPGGQ